MSRAPDLPPVASEGGRLGRGFVIIVFDVDRVRILILRRRPGTGAQSTVANSVHLMHGRRVSARARLRLLLVFSNFGFHVGQDAGHDRQKQPLPATKRVARKDHLGSNRVETSRCSSIACRT
jgi:hypothetical protein